MAAFLLTGIGRMSGRGFCGALPPQGRFGEAEYQLQKILNLTKSLPLTTMKGESRDYTGHRPILTLAKVVPGIVLEMGIEGFVV